MKITPVSESTLLIRFGDVISEDVSRQVTAFMQDASHHLADVILDMTPSYTTILCWYDHHQVDYGWMVRELKALDESVAVGADDPASGPVVEIPVWYDPEVGYDLEEMIQTKGISHQELVERHTRQTYRVYAIGFIPGFPFMGQVEEMLITPRRTTPRPSVAAGSVGIADSQTSIYPIRSPGGWNIIGRSPTRLFTPESETGDVSLLKAGDEVRFVAIDRATFKEMGGRI